MREPVTKVFRRAGCGKSARPVRRGDGKSRINPLLPVLLYRPTFYCAVTLKPSTTMRGFSPRVSDSKRSVVTWRFSPGIRAI